MKYRLDPKLERTTIDGFAFPLGWRPRDHRRPLEGYTITYQPSDGELPEAHQYVIVASHECLAGIIAKLMAILPSEVHPILEAGSRDAYRQVDVLMSEDPMSKSHFLAIWKYFEPVLLEDGAVAAGALSEEPYIEVFVDEYKNVSVTVPVDRAAEFEAMFAGMDLAEVPQHWEDDEGEDELVSVLDSGSGLLTLDEIIIHLQRAWRLELNVNLDSNVDEAGRELGVTLWHIVALAQPRGENSEADLAYVDIWLSADSLGQVEELVTGVFDGLDEWVLDTMIAQDRVAYDDRPDGLHDHEPGSKETAVWSVAVEPLG